MTSFAISLDLTAAYLTAQEKRAQAELEDSLEAMSPQTAQRLCEVIAKRADAPQVLQSIAAAVKSAKCRKKRYMKKLTKSAAATLDKKADMQQIIERLKALGSTPLGTAAIGGVGGATLGGVSGLVRGKGLRGAAGDAMRGGVAGAALGGGAGLVARGLANNGPAAEDATQLGDLNSAIAGYQTQSQSNYLPLAASGLGWGYGVNAIDSALARRSPAEAFLAANVGNYRGRTETLARLNEWLAANEKMPGRDSVEAFAKMISQETNPVGQDRIFSRLANSLAGGDVNAGNATFQKMLDRSGLLGSLADGKGDPLPQLTPDIDSVARALNESRPVGWQFLPANLLRRLGLAMPEKVFGQPIATPVQKALKRIPYQKDVSRALNNMNATLARPLLRGRAGLLGGLSVLGAGLGLDMMAGESGGDTTASPEVIARIREQLVQP